MVAGHWVDHVGTDQDVAPLWTIDLPCTHSVSLACGLYTTVHCYCYGVLSKLYLELASSMHNCTHFICLLPSLCTPSHQPATLWAICYELCSYSVHSLPLTDCITPRPQFLHCFYSPGCSGPSGFSKWLSENKKTLQEAHIGASDEEIVKLGIKQWRAMPKEEKQHWQ